MKMDRKKIAAQAAGYGRSGFRLALRAGILYVIFTIAGLICGGVGGYWGAEHFGTGAFVAAAAAVAGIVAGGLAGFFLAQVVILGLIQDMLLEAGIKTGKTGYRAAMKLLKDRQEREKGNNGRNED